MTQTPQDDEQSPRYRDPTVPVADRVEDLLRRMTIDEKIAQLGSAWVFELADGDRLSADRAARLCRHGLGQVTRVSGASTLTADRAARLANRIQRHLVENTRLGIPAIVHEEICSGVMARGSTVFPQAIGVAATFQPELNEAIADSIRIQMRSAGAHQGLSPVLDITRDPRWGRTEETYGEDPYLVGRMGTAFVTGLQGDDPTTGIVATAKHFVGYGASEGGMNWAPARIPDRELREVYLHPFEATVRDAGIRSVMNAYQELDGIPCAANDTLLTGVLRGEWGFDGTVVSDYFAIDQLATYHHLVADKVEAAATALASGIDVELPSADCYADPLLAAIDNGDVAIEALDTAVRRVLSQKLELGLFERPYVDESVAVEAVDIAEHRALAATVARNSIVLLHNEGILPLPADPGVVAVIGPNADTARNLFGDYAYPAHIESLLEMHDSDNVFGIPVPRDLDSSVLHLRDRTVLESLRARFGPGVLYAEGCDVNGDDRSGIAAAVAAAERADVVVLVVGDKAGLTEECTSGEGRDRSSLDLPGVQEDLARAVLDTGTPVVTVLVVGRPCGSQDLHERSAAVVLAWLPGQEGAEAVADVLTGVYNPGGKLPMSFPRSVGQLPVFYGHKVSGGRSHWKGDYVDGPTTPLYPFGFGLSYTTFEISEPSLETSTVGAEDSVRLAVAVSNVGEVAGDEVVQVYVRDPDATVTRPVLELKSFLRVAIDPGQAKTLRFELPMGQLGFYDRELRYVVEQGDLEIFVGNSARDVRLAGRVKVTAAGPIAKVFDGARSVT